MKIGIYQFKVSESIESNYKKIKDAAVSAASDKCRLLLTQECALTGYPPIEIEALDKIDFEKVKLLTEKLYKLANELEIYIALGTIRKINGKYLNSIEIISPNGEVNFYDKRALWGYDQNNFIPGENDYILEIDDKKIGFRICFEIRFPEYFRELYLKNVDIVCVPFCDISDIENEGRLNILKSYLITRAIENAYTIISINGVTKFQTAPSLIINPDGYILKELPLNKENLLIYNFEKSNSNFGRDGRLYYNNLLTKKPH